MTKLKVKEIQLLHAISGDEPWPEEEVAEEPNVVQEEANTDAEVSSEEKQKKSPKEKESEPDEIVSDEGPVEVEWDLTSDDKESEKKDKKNPIKDADDESEQPTLF